MIYDGVAGVARHVEDPEIGSLAYRFVGELATIEAAWYHHIGQQKINVLLSGQNLRAAAPSLAVTT